jgi:hypothetical protein
LLQGSHRLFEFFALSHCHITLAGLDPFDTAKGHAELTSSRTSPCGITRVNWPSPFAGF